VKEWAEENAMTEKQKCAQDDPGMSLVMDRLVRRLGIKDRGEAEAKLSLELLSHWPRQETIVVVGIDDSEVIRIYV